MWIKTGIVVGVRARRAAIVGCLAVSVMGGTASCLPAAIVSATSASPASASPAAVVPPGLYGVAAGRSYYLTGSLTKGPRHELVVVLGGIYLSAATTQTQTGWTPVGVAHKATIVYGISAAGFSGWNAGGCCGSAAATKVDDVGYLANVVADVSHRLTIDRTRVYVVGFSNGAMLAERAVCERGDIFAAAGAVAGDLLVRCPVGARVVAVHGLIDGTVPYHGGYSGFVNFTFPSVLAERRAILYGHPAAAYTLVTLAKVGHGWPTQAQGFDTTPQLWARLQPYHL